MIVLTMVVFLSENFMGVLVMIVLDVNVFIANFRCLNRWVQVMRVCSMRSTQIRCGTLMVVVVFWVMIIVVILLLWWFFQVGVD